MEIENFKGIGRRVRIDLRPVTLLFGPNSAGKSTILHAICYAQEILSRRSVDAGKTTLGGEQVDLGGFRRFVHAHDTGRRVHLAFELDLEGRTLSSQLHTDDLQYLPLEKDELDQAADAVTSGWLKLRIGWNQRLKTPSVESYAVGVDNACVGRIETAAETDRPSLPRFLPNLQHSVFTRAGFSKNDHDRRAPHPDVMKRGRLLPTDRGTLRCWLAGSVILQKRKRGSRRRSYSVEGFDPSPRKN